MIYYIYKITLTEGSLAGHYYIGQRSFRGDDILEDKYKGSGKILKQYYKKYPFGFIKTVLKVVQTKEQLNTEEERFIGDLYKTDPLCINCCKGGAFVKNLSSFDGINKGRKHSEQFKEYLRTLMLGKKRGTYNWTKKGLEKIHSPKSEEAKVNMRKKHNPMSEEGKINISKGHIGKCFCKFGEEWRKKQSLAQKGKRHKPDTEETKLKKSLALKGKPKSKEVINKIKNFKSSPILLLKDNKVLGFYRDGEEVSELLNISRVSINYCIRNNYFTKNGFSFHRV